MSPSREITETPAAGGKTRAGWLRKSFSILFKSLIGLLFIGAMAAGTTALHLRASAEKGPSPYPPVSVQTRKLVAETSYKTTISYVGRLEPARRTQLAFERGGLVIRVAADEGTRVRTGQVIAELDTASLRASRRQLEAQRRELQARRKLAELTLKRQTKLKISGWASVQRFDEAQARLAQVNAQLDRIRAQLNAIDIDIQKSRLTAPFDGVIGARSLDEGAVAAAGAAVLTLLEAGKRQVRVGLPPEKAAQLKPARDYKFTAGTRTFTGRLALQRPDLDAATRTATVVFDVPDSNDMAFGDIVTMRLENEIPERGFWLPVTALKEGQKGLWTVLVTATADAGGTSVAGGMIVKAEAVEILHASAQSVFVRGTLRAGDRVIVVGTNRVIHGQRVALASE